MWNVERVAEVALTFGKGVGLWREDDDKSCAASYVNRVS